MRGYARVPGGSGRARRDSSSVLLAARYTRRFAGPGSPENASTASANSRRARRRAPSEPLGWSRFMPSTMPSGAARVCTASAKLDYRPAGSAAFRSAGMPIGGWPCRQGRVRSRCLSDRHHPQRGLGHGHRPSAAPARSRRAAPDGITDDVDRLLAVPTGPPRLRVGGRGTCDQRASLVRARRSAATGAWGVQLLRRIDLQPQSSGRRAHRCLSINSVAM